MWSNVVVGVVVLAAALYAGYRLFRRPASGCGCGCGCSGMKNGSCATDPSADHGGCCGGKRGGCGCLH